MKSAERTSCDEPEARILNSASCVLRALCRAAVAVCAPARPLLAVRPRLTAAPAGLAAPRLRVRSPRARDARHARLTLTLTPGVVVHTDTPYPLKGLPGPTTVVSVV